MMPRVVQPRPTGRLPKQLPWCRRVPALLLLLSGAGFLSANGGQGEIKRGDLWKADVQATLQAGQKKDSGSELLALLKLCSDFPESARALRNLAWAEQKAGDREQAVKFLRQYASMGMTLDPGGVIYKSFVSSGMLDAVPELKPNGAPVTSGSLVFSLKDPNLLVEDIGFDAESHRFFLTSVHEKKILECDSTGRCEDVVHSSPDMPLNALLAIHVDAPREALWATSVGMNAQADFRPEYEGHSAVLKFDLRSHRRTARYEPNDTREHALGDMTVASNGDAYISDGTSGDVYVIKHDGGRLETLVPAGVFVSPQTPALSGDESLLYVPDYSEGIAVINLKSGSTEWVKSENPTALNGIDGFYWTKTGLIATQNGTSPERVVRFRLSAYNRIDGFDVLEANWPGLGDPTHGVIVGSDFYFIVNSGWDRVGEDGVLRDGAPAAIWRMPIGSR
jgi:hypothetical protein